jgi:NADP-dependent 3-hydroxy acid dehydrogenase YdfG
MERLRPALARLRRQKLIIELREKVTKPDLKFVLALLANVTDKQILFDLLKQRYPSQDPIGVLINTFGELSAQDLFNVHFNDAWLLMLESLFKGISDLAEIRRLFEQKYGTEQVSVQGLKLDSLALKLRKFWLVQPYIDDTLYI